MSLSHPVLVEICVDDLAGSLAAEAAGAARIELCSALSEGGVTPSLGLVETVMDRVPRIGVQIMIRPRGGHFVVDDTELAVMLADVAALRRLDTASDGRIGFVFGALTPDGQIDSRVIAALKAACGAAPTTFHKAFDMARDRPRALETLAGLGIDRILTSGGAATAEQGADALRALVRQAGERIVILAGGGVRAHNVRSIVERTGVAEVHLRAMRDRAGRPPVTSAEDIAAVVAAIDHDVFGWNPKT